MLDPAYFPLVFEVKSVGIVADREATTLFAGMAEDLVELLFYWTTIREVRRIVRNIGYRTFYIEPDTEIPAVREALWWYLKSEEYYVFASHNNKPNNEYDSDEETIVP